MARYYTLNPKNHLNHAPNGVSFAKQNRKLGDVFQAPPGKDYDDFCERGKNGSLPILVRASGPSVVPTGKCPRCGEGTNAEVPCSVECFVKAGYEAENFETFVSRSREEIAARNARASADAPDMSKQFEFEPRQPAGPPVNPRAPASVTAPESLVNKELASVLKPAYKPKTDEGQDEQKQVTQSLADDSTPPSNPADQTGHGAITEAYGATSTNPTTTATARTQEVAKGGSSGKTRK
jgi:hypothetical protein